MSDGFEEMKQYVLCLMQALLGVISPNFRCVTISRRVEGFVVRIYLETHCDEDAEEIDDLGVELDALLLPERVDFDIETIVTREPLNLPLMNESFVVVFRRREGVLS